MLMYIAKLQPLLLQKLFIKRLWFLAHPRSSLYIGSMLHLVYLYHAIGISLNNYANMFCDEHEGRARGQRICYKPTTRYITVLDAQD